MPKVYIASKMHHADEWRKLYSKYPYIHIVSRWPFLEPFVSAAAVNAVKFWSDDEADIRAADYVVVFALPGEHLRGALVEAGIGIGLGKKVVVIGEHPDYGTWQHHPQVEQAPDLETALVWINQGTL